MVRNMRAEWRRGAGLARVEWGRLRRGTARSLEVFRRQDFQPWPELLQGSPLTATRLVGLVKERCEWRDRGVGLLSNNKQITGNIGLYHVARELSLAGWNVMPTVRNARGADLYAASADERTIHPVQVKAHSDTPQDTKLGLAPEKLVTPWWVFVVYARTPDIACYVFALDEIFELMSRDPGTRSGKAEKERNFWFNRKYYTPGGESEKKEARNGWNCLGSPRYDF